MKRSGDISDNKYVITSRQSASIISSTIIGVGVLTLPRVTAEYSKEAGWISTILGALVAMLAIAVITKLWERFPGKNIVTYAPDILGTPKAPWVGRILSLPVCLGIIIFWALYTVVVARTFGEVVVTTVLTQTPLEIIILTMLATAMLLVMYDIEVVARVNEVLLPIIIFPVLLIGLSSFQSAKLENILPLFFLDWNSFFIGVLTSAYAYLGFEVMLIFFAYVQPGTQVMKANLIGIAIPGLIYTLITISGISVFGVEELRLLAWPTLELVKVTEVPGLILERMESAFLGVWVAAVFTTVGNLYYAISVMINQTLGIRSDKGRRIIAFLLLPLLYWLSLQPPNIHELFRYQGILGNIGGGIVFVLPLLLWLGALVRKKSSREETSTP